jgi:hypothetical protein
MVSFHKHLGLAALVAVMIGVTWLPRAEASRLLDVTNFGVVGDGKTDNQIALEHVFAIATPQTIVLFPPGVYLHSGRLSVGREVVVLGAQATLFGTNANAQSLNISGNGSEVTGLAFQGQSGGDPAITLSNVNNTIIKTNLFIGFTNDVVITNSQQVNVETNIFEPGSSGTAVIASGQHVRIEGNTFTGFPSPESQTGVSGSVTDLVIDKGNFFNQLTVAVKVSNSKSATIDKNAFGACQTVISSTGASNTSITNNTCTNGNAFFDGASVGTAGLYVALNSVTTFNSVFQNFRSNTDTTIVGNTFRAVGGVLSLVGNQNMVVRSNTISGCPSAIIGELDTKLLIENNTFNQCNSSLNLVSENSVTVHSNTFTASDGIKVSNSTDVNVGGNHMNNIATQGVNSNQNTGKVQIHDNELLNCGLSAGVNPQAVIFASGGSDLSIMNNLYSGNTAHLLYFIDTPVSGAKVTGNETATMLPNKIGP